ncbi:MAG: hypothetical protein J1F07_05920 [Muribaculaceae bacterium]|nr:hypothetical protein [Muribaculaceae bacterium]
MMKNFSVLILSMLLIGCNNQSKNYKEREFLCFNEEYVYIQYSEPIEGYDIKVKVSLDTVHSRPYRAFIDFSKGGKAISQIFHPDFFLPDEKLSEYENNSIITANYKTPIVNDTGVVRLDTFRYVPFFFLDVDFDGMKELLINHFGMGQRGEAAFEVINLEDNNYYGNLDYREKPFLSLDSLTEIDFDNKTITKISIISGGCEWWIRKFIKTDIGFEEIIEKHEKQYDENHNPIEIIQTITPE